MTSIADTWLKLNLRNTNSDKYHTFLMLLFYQHKYLPKRQFYHYNIFIICTNINLRKLTDNIRWKTALKTIIMLKFLSFYLEVTCHLNQIWFLYIFHHNHLSFYLFTYLNLWFYSTVLHIFLIHYFFYFR